MIQYRAAADRANGTRREKKEDLKLKFAAITGTHFSLDKTDRCANPERPNDWI
jgi:hypothetical protein